MLQQLPAVLVLQAKPATRCERERHPGHTGPLAGHRPGQRLLGYEETGEQVDPLVRVFPVRHEAFLHGLQQVEEEELSVLARNILSTGKTFRTFTYGPKISFLTPFTLSLFY